jgi:hypothetical protein
MSKTLSAVLLSSLALATTASAQQNIVEIKTDDKQRCFSGNGLPDHETGSFPNRGNPNAIGPQDVKMCVTATPVKGAVAQPVRGAIGIAVNGVQFRPTTAGFYDPNGRRGHSRNGDRNWSLDIHGAPGKLGLDFNNAHVGRGGLYHYHGIASSLTETSGSTLIGYAADGFEMHYVGEAVTSGYRLKSGERPSGPGGAFDGTYNEDYERINSADLLDQCNGGMLDGQYVYFVTESYPFVGRCLWGEISKDFAGGEHTGREGGQQRGGREGRRPRRDRRGRN